VFYESDEQFIEGQDQRSVAWLLEHFNDLRETERQLHFWKKACDDAHNLGAARLKVATDALELVKQHATPYDSADASAVDTKWVIGIINDTLKELE
jgi:hypothetical protein